MEKDGPVRAISRSIVALKAINRHGSMTISEIAKTSEVPYPTAARIVQTLLYEGLIERSPKRKRYRPTALVKLLSQGYQENNLVKIARPHISALSNQIGWPVMLSVRAGRNLMLRDWTSTKNLSISEHYFYHFRIPILGSASGKLLLAYADDKERRLIINWMRNSDDIDSEYLDIPKMDAETELILAQGYATQDVCFPRIAHEDTSSIAVPIFANEKFEAALATTFLSSDMQIEAALESFLTHLKETSAKISVGLNSVIQPDH